MESNQRGVLPDEGEGERKYSVALDSCSLYNSIIVITNILPILVLTMSFLGLGQVSQDDVVRPVDNPGRIKVKDRTARVKMMKARAAKEAWVKTAKNESRAEIRSTIAEAMFMFANTQVAQAKADKATQIVRVRAVKAEMAESEAKTLYDEAEPMIAKARDKKHESIKATMAKTKALEMKARRMKAMEMGAVAEAKAKPLRPKAVKAKIEAEAAKARAKPLKPKAAKAKIEAAKVRVPNAEVAAGSAES